VIFSTRGRQNLRPGLAKIIGQRTSLLPAASTSVAVALKAGRPAWRKPKIDWLTSPTA